MTARQLSVVSIVAAWAAIAAAALPEPALAETPLPGGFEIQLLPGYSHEPLQGIDSSVGKIVSKDGVEIMYEIGPVPAPGGLLVGGSYSNQAANLREPLRQWARQQTVHGRKFDIAYSKDQQLVISTATASRGINLTATAKTPAQIADVLLMTLTLTEQKPK